MIVNRHSNGLSGKPTAHQAGHPLLRLCLLLWPFIMIAR